MLLTRRFWFSHIPKTGGSFIKNVLMKLEPEHINLGAHLALSQLPDDRPFTFSFVRHPVTRTKSWWAEYWIRMRHRRHIWHHPEMQILRDRSCESLGDAVDALLHHPEYLASAIYPEFVGSAERPVDFVGKLENMDSDLPLVLLSLGFLESDISGAMMLAKKAHETDYSCVPMNCSPALMRELKSAEDSAVRRFGYAED